MKLHVWSATSTEAGRVYVMAHPIGDYDASPIFEIADGKAKQIHQLAGVEDLVGHGKLLYAIGESDLGAQVHIFDGKKWTTHQSGDASIHSGVILDGKLVGIGRDGFVGTWNKTRWKLATKEHYNLHLSGAAYDGKALVVAGSKGGKGVLGTVIAGKIKPAKLPAKAELLGLASLANGELLATGHDGTALVGHVGEMRVVAPGKIKTDLGNVVEHDGKVLIAARDAGVAELVGDALRVFSKEPAQSLAVTGETLWKCDRKAGLARWTGKAWAAVKF